MALRLHWVGSIFSLVSICLFTHLHVGCVSDSDSGNPSNPNPLETVGKLPDSVETGVGPGGLKWANLGGVKWAIEAAKVDVKPWRDTQWVYLSRQPKPYCNDPENPSCSLSVTQFRERQYPWVSGRSVCKNGWRLPNKDDVDFTKDYIQSLKPAEPLDTTRCFEKLKAYGVVIDFDKMSQTKADKTCADNLGDEHSAMAKKIVLRAIWKSEAPEQELIRYWGGDSTSSYYLSMDHGHFNNGDFKKNEYRAAHCVLEE